MFRDDAPLGLGKALGSVVSRADASARTPARRHWGSIVVFGIVLCASFVSIGERGSSLIDALAHSDFRAYYCAGADALERADPYRTIPLAACQSRLVGSELAIHFDAQQPDPAPLPGYAIALFSAFASVPFAVAAIAWYGILIGAIWGTIAGLKRLTGLPSPVAAAALYGTEVVVCVAFGQLIPIVTCALVWSAVLVSVEKYRTAGALICVTLLAPQVGIPATAALAIWKPRSRVAIGAGVGLLACISLVALGLPENLDYVKAVLPAQAFAQAPLDIQYSFTWVLYFFGVSDANAVLFGSFQYGFVIALALLLAGPLARKLGSPATIILFPAAASVLGGSYIHYFQLASAVPFAMVVAAQRSRASAVGYIACCLLMFPLVGSLPGPILFLSAIAAATLGLIGSGGLTHPLRLLIPVLLATVVVFAPLERDAVSGRILRTDPTISSYDLAHLDRSLASTQLAVRIRELPASTGTSWRLFGEKVPGWLGLLLLFGYGSLRYFGRGAGPTDTAATATVATSCAASPR